MPIGDLLHYSFLLVAARSFSTLERAVTTVRLFLGAVETSVPDEVLSVPGKKGRNVTVHVHLNEAAKKAKVERRPCVTYITLHGMAPFHAHSKYLLAFQVVVLSSKDTVLMPVSLTTSSSPPS